MLEIRRARLEDLPVVQQLGYGLLRYEQQRWDETLKLDWPFTEAGERAYREAINNRYVLLASMNSKAVGFLIGNIQIPPADAARGTVMANLNNIYVEESMHGQGIGGKLFKTFKEFCQEQHVKKINVTVNSQNSQAIEFYKKHDFVSSRMIMTCNVEE